MDMNELMEKAREMQEEIKKIQQKNAVNEIVGVSGAGMVKVVLNGLYAAKKITIDPSLYKEDSGVLEDLIVAAINDAVNQIEKNNKETVQGLTANT